MIRRFVGKTLGILFGFYLFVVFVLPMSAPVIGAALEIIRASLTLTLLASFVPPLILYLAIRRRVAPRPKRAPVQPKARAPRRAAPPPVVQQGHGAREHVPQSLSDELADFLNENLRR